MEERNHPHHRQLHIIYLVLRNQKATDKVDKGKNFPWYRDSGYEVFRRTASEEKPDNIIIHVRTNNAAQSTSYEMFHEIQSLRNFILKCLPSERIAISTPLLRVDKANANGINQDFKEMVKESRLDYFSHQNIKESHIDEYVLHINRTGSSILAKNLISVIHNS